MDEKTEELRELFKDVASDETVTERQEESPGTLPDGSEARDRVRTIVRELRDRYEFRTDLDESALLTVADGFYAGKADTEIANELDVPSAMVTAARFDLHLVGEADLDGPASREELRAAIDAEEGTASIAADDPDAVERQIDAMRAAVRMRRESYRFRDEFDELLGDADVAKQLPAELTDDGLREATEDMEIETGF